MSKRLDQDRENRLQPKRINDALVALDELKLEVVSIDATTVQFIYKGNKITFYPYSGWHTGKGITDGRGHKHLFDQLKKQ